MIAWSNNLDFAGSGLDTPATATGSDTTNKVRPIPARHRILFCYPLLILGPHLLWISLSRLSS